MSLLCLSTGSIYLFISSRLVSEHLTLISALIQFILTYSGLYIGKRRLERLSSCSRNPRQTQEDLLHEIISHNKNTEYSVRFKLHDITCLADFRAKHPLTKYDHYELYVQRIAKGEKNIMTADRVSRLIVTSGTTGKGKLIPANMAKIGPILAVNAIRQKTFPVLQPLQRGFRLHCNSKLSKSECGITIAAGMVIEKSMTPLLVSFSTPPDGFMIESIDKSIHKYPQVSTSVFASTFVDGFKYFEDHWPQMVEDLANGTLNEDLALPAPIRDSLTRAIGSGGPTRAEEVRRECEKGQQGIMRRLWPRMVCVATIDNIGIRDRLMETFAEGLVVFSWLYGSSEALIGLNCNPLQSGKEEYALAINDCIYEFIPDGDM